MEKRAPMERVRHQKRPGFEGLGIRLLYWLLYPFFHCRVELSSEMKERKEPVVFIANHYNLFGPVSYVMSMPYLSYLWINESLIRREGAAKALEPGIKKMLPFLGKRIQNWLAEKMAGLISTVLPRFGVIAVDRDQPSKMIHTLRESMDMLEEGYHLMICPETGEPEYSLTSVTPFYSGFAALGRMYYRKTGKILQFCPCYIDEQHHSIRLGELVSYDPANPDSREEMQRVSDELNRRIRVMAAQNRGLHREESSPIRQTVLFSCHVLRFLLLIPLVTLLGLSREQPAMILYGISQVLRLIINLVCSSFPATNRMSNLFGHGVELLMDTFMLGYMAQARAFPRTMVWILIISGLLILFSNVWAFLRFRRCAGLNYFDGVSVNLLCALCFQQGLRFQLKGILERILIQLGAVFLLIAAFCAFLFNARLARE